MKIIISTILIYAFIILYDYLLRKKISNKINIGDKKRIFNSDESKFDNVTVINIYKKGNKKIATCKHVNGNIENIPIMDLIY